MDIFDVVLFNADTLLNIIASMPEIANSSTEFLRLSKVYTDEGGIK